MTTPHCVAARGVCVLIACLAAAVFPVRPSSAAAPYRLLITGDSITQGSSGDYTWRYRLWAKLRRTAPSEVAFVGPRSDLFNNVLDTMGSQYYAAPFPGKAHGAKWGGSLVYDGTDISAQVRSSKPNVLVTMFGSNDLAYLTSPSQTIANLRTHIGRAGAAAPGIDVIVCQVVNRYDPWSQSYTLTEESSEYAALLATLAAQLDTPSQRVVVAATRDGWDAGAMIRTCGWPSAG